MSHLQTANEHETGIAGQVDGLRMLARIIARAYALHNQGRDKVGIVEAIQAPRDRGHKRKDGKD